MNLRRLSALVLLPVVGMLAVPSMAAAHPLGNFTINHYSRIQVDSNTVTVRWVLDMAEIPAFSEVQRIDVSGDEQVSDDEARAWLDERLPELLLDMELLVDGRPSTLRVVDRELSFPPGQGGLPTLRLVVDLVADRAAGPGTVTYRDGTYPARIGWRELVVRAGPGVRLSETDAPATDRSIELTSYPADAMIAPADSRETSFRFVVDGGANTAPDSTTGLPGPRPDDPLARLVGGELSLVSAGLALLLAMGLGVAHGVSPGHGKTLVAAYLIGSRGTLPQAVWLGVTVAVTHTLGVFILGGVTLLATALIVPDRVIGWLSMLSGVLVICLGLALLWRQLRARAAPSASVHAHPQPHGPGHAHPHPHPHAEPRSPEVSRRGIVTLGLVGGMVPSASALLVLLVAITLDRLAFGLLLIVAFGVGMAAVLAGISAAVVLLRRQVEARDAAWLQHPALRRIGSAVPLASALAVLVIGVVLSAGAAGVLG